MNTLSSLLKFIANSIAPIISNQTAKKVLAAPNGATGKPSFRELGASDITSGAFTTDRIPNLDASKINSGTLNTARIPNLDASKVTSGTFATARIPNLDASKINSGTFGADRVPAISTLQTQINNEKHRIETGSYVYNGTSTSTITFMDDNLVGKHYIIAGAQDAGNPPLRCEIETDNLSYAQVKVYLATPVTVMRVNYIAW